MSNLLYTTGTAWFDEGSVVNGRNLTIRILQKPDLSFLRDAVHALKDLHEANDLVLAL